MSDSADRIRAARALIRVEEGAFSSRLLAGAPAPGVRARVLGVLRWQRRLDAALSRLCRRPIPRLDPEVRAVLRLGLFEGTVLGVPVAVATDASVAVVRRLGKSSAAGMVNAVLRRGSAAWHDLTAEATPDVLLSHPAWLYRRWCDHLGRDRAETMMEANQEPAPTWVWFLDDTTRVELEAVGVGLEEHPWCPDTWSAPDGARQLLAQVAAGAAYAQDPSSQLVARIALGLASGGRVVDLCAAPGGKAALLLRSRRWQGFVAADVRHRRSRLVRDLLSRVGAEHTVVVADGVCPPLPQGVADLVLVDAPCSGTGTVRRHPELRWRLQAEALPGLAATQARLLRSGLDLLAPGGVLVYATCSLEPEENEAHLAEVPAGFSVPEIGGLLPAGVPRTETSAGGVRLPITREGDGFTVHALRRA